jgi:hypothetical protein
LFQLKVQILILSREYFFFPLIEEQVDPTVWTDSTTVSHAKTVQIKLKDPLQCLHQKQYTLKPEGQQGLLPIINFLKQNGLLVECSSLYNTPTLPVCKRPNKWRLVQDLRLANEAVVPLHPIFPSPYTLLVQIPPKLNTTLC